MEIKRHWLGDSFYIPGVPGNSIHKTNVPNTRVAFRHETLIEERALIAQGASSKFEGHHNSDVVSWKAGISADTVGAAAMGTSNHLVAKENDHGVISPGISALSQKHEKQLSISGQPTRVS